MTDASFSLSSGGDMTACNEKTFGKLGGSRVLQVEGCGADSGVQRKESGDRA
jgi:hypothetical protein